MKITEFTDASGAVKKSLQKTLKYLKLDNLSVFCQQKALRCLRLKAFGFTTARITALAFVS